METNAGSSVRVFDGTTDFRVWRARVENELMRYHLLGYVLVRGYDGSQSFTYNGEEVPPRTPVIHVDDEQSIVKEEASCGRHIVAQQGRLSRWDVLGESAEAKSILQRFLHPDVEAAILNKNIYDSWKMLCALYGNRSNPGAHDVYEMHRVLHHIRLGDKKGEPVREFITRWEMLMQQYALATGIQLTDGFRSVSLTQTLPSAWRPLVASWRGIRPYVPYAELVEKMIATRERMQVQAETTSVPNTTVVKSTNSSVDMQVAQLPDKSTDKSAAVKPVAQPIAKAVEKTGEKSTIKPTEKQTVSQPVEKEVEKPVEQRAAEAPKSIEKATSSRKAAPPPTDVSTGANNTVDLTTGEVSTSLAKSKIPTSTRSRASTKKSPIERTDNADTPRSSKNTKVDDRHEKNDTYEKRSQYDKYDSDRGYDKFASFNRFDKSPRKSRSRYEKKYDYFDNSGPVSCFYCLRVGHHMKRCWYLKADIENGTTHDKHKKFSCAVTIDRNQFMVHCLESYIDEVNRERAAYGGTTSTTTASRSHGDYAVSESVGRKYHPQQQDFVPPPPPGQPPAYAFRDQQQQSLSASAADYRKRSHSVFQKTEGHISSQDPRINRSRSAYRSTDAAEDFSPRKRTRAPSFERELQSYY